MEIIIWFGMSLPGILWEDCKGEGGTLVMKHNNEHIL